MASHKLLNSTNSFHLTSNDGSTEVNSARDSLHLSNGLKKNLDYVSNVKQMSSNTFPKDFKQFPVVNNYLDDLNEMLTSTTAQGYTEDIDFGNDELEEEELIEQAPSYPVDYDVEDNDSEDEGIDGYRIGGYHPIHIGEVLQERYVVIQKLGWGHFSTVWLCKDFKYDTYVAIKVQKSASNYMEAAYDEVEILQRVSKNVSKPEWVESLKEYYKEEGKIEFTRDDCHVVQLLNSFIYQGPYGNHFCMVFEIMGVNLLEIIKRYNYKGCVLQVPMHLCRKMAKQILIGLDYLHRICGLIHTDLKPENILLCLTPEEIKDIVENGQLSRSKQYEERIREYQQKQGIVPNAQKLNNNTNQKKKTKNQKKKEKKKLKKQQEKQQKISLPEQQAQTKPKFHHRSSSFYSEPLTGASMVRFLSLQHMMKTSDEDEEIGLNNKNAKNEAQKALNNNMNPEIRGPALSENFQLKVVDLGNACWKHHHFSDEIQTRQYRSPEVMIGVNYNDSADIWSFACTIFEMLTGDFLFEPKSGPNFNKDDDHLAQIIERISKIPKKFALSGTQSKEFFDKKGNLRRIQAFHYWPLKEVLIQKYHIKEDEADAFTKFLLPMLNWYPHKRISAQKALEHPWLKMAQNLYYKLTPNQIKKKTQLRQRTDDLGYSSIEEIQSEDIEGDKESDDNDAVSDFSCEEHDNYGYDNLLNRSFNNGGYVPYGGGINLEEMDQDPNFQFIDANDVIGAEN